MKILLVDDQALFRDGIALVLQRLAEPLQLLHTDTGNQALQLARQHADLALILLDLALPYRADFEVLEEFRHRQPSVPVIVMSGSHTRMDILKAIELGAKGYVPKSTSSEVMLSVIKLVLAGGVYVPAEVLTTLPIATTEPESDTQSTLTERQTEVLHWLARGQSNKQIGNHLGISESTVRVHAHAIFRALGVNNRTEAGYAAQKQGWLANDI